MGKIREEIKIASKPGKNVSSQRLPLLCWLGKKRISKGGWLKCTKNNPACCIMLDKSVGDLNSKVAELTKEKEEATRKVAEVENLLASKVKVFTVLLTIKGEFIRYIFHILLHSTSIVRIWCDFFGEPHLIVLLTFMCTKCRYLCTLYGYVFVHLKLIISLDFELQNRNKFRSLLRKFGESIRIIWYVLKVKTRLEPTVALLCEYHCIFYIYLHNMI